MKTTHSTSLRGAAETQLMEIVPMAATKQSGHVLKFCVWTRLLRRIGQRARVSDTRSLLAMTRVGKYACDGNNVNCSKAGEGVGVRKQIETFSSSKPAQERVSMIEETVICSKKAVIKAEKLLKWNSFPTKGKLKTMKTNINSRDRNAHPRRPQRLSFSFAAFSAQMQTRQIVEPKIIKVVV